MIELYHPANSETGTAIEAALKKLVLAHKVIIVEIGQHPPGIPANTPLPALKDEGQIITGPDALKAHLMYLEQVTDEWRKFQSDSCYVDSDGGNC